MRRWPLVAGVAAVVCFGALVLVRSGWFGAKATEPRPVPDGDREIAWLHGGELGVRARRDLVPAGIVIAFARHLPRLRQDCVGAWVWCADADL